MSNSMIKTKLFINGEWVDPLSKMYVDVINPATEQVIAQCANANEADVELAVKAARNCFEGTNWSHSGKDRAIYLRAIADKLAEKREQFILLETLNNGKPLKESEFDVDDTIGCFKYYADQAEQLDKKQNQSVTLSNSSFQCKLRYEAIGVAACIIPWNYPLLMAAWKLGPALASGCTVVLKPSEVTPLTALQLMAITQEIKLPRGVLNVVTGVGALTGESLVKHKLIDKVAFTGSVPTGSHIMNLCSPLIRNVTLELGGKSPIIIFDDVDIAKTVDWIMFGCFVTNGQVCSATSRLLVQDTIAKKLIKGLVEETQNIKIDNPNTDIYRNATGMLGPIVSKTQWNRVNSYVQGAIKEGAVLLTGGKKPNHLTKGYFYEPTILKVKPTMKIWKEEVFGPVLSLMEFKTEREAIALANDSEYGLAGAVISANKERCERIAKALRVGVMWINCSQPTFIEAPWGGFKKSGIGRELGPWGMDNYLEVKQITEYTSPDPWGWYIKPKL